MLRFLALAAAACAVSLQGEEAHFPGKRAIFEAGFKKWIAEHKKSHAKGK